MANVRTILATASLLALSFLVIQYFAPSVHPYAGVAPSQNADEVLAESKRLLKDVGYDVSELTPGVMFRYNRSLVRQMQEEYGMEQGNSFIRTQIPAYYWEVRWRKKSQLESMLASTGSEVREVEKTLRILLGEIVMRIDQHGRLLELASKPADSVKLPAVTDQEARKIALGFLHRYSMFREISEDSAAGVPGAGRAEATPSPSISFESSKRLEQTHRVDFDFVWTAKSPLLHDKIKISVSVAGNMVSKYNVAYQVPERYSSTDSSAIHKFALALMYIAAIVIMIIIAVRRLRAYEIGYRLGIIFGIVAALSWGFTMYQTMRQQLGLELLLGLALGPLFFGGAFVVCWAISESAAREVWNDRLISFDLLSKGYLFHSRVGRNLLWGIAIGAFGFGLWLALLKGVDFFWPIWINYAGDKGLNTFDSENSVLYVLSQGLYNNLYLYACFILLVASLLRKRFDAIPIITLIGAVIYSILNYQDVQPLPAGFATEFVMGALFVYTLCRFDGLAALVAMVVYSVTKETSGLFLAGQATFSSSATVVLIVLGAVYAASGASLFRKREIQEFEAITPTFAQRISERQRLQQELEIARRVQMSFLPKANPVVYGLDIASRCAPAQEVGGDYYDFIDLGPKRLGVVIGDVSGKGTQAAFFMTLTKGFLRAIARLSNSPSEVLTQVNQLFYENVGRGVFISMVYAIFDVDSRIVVIARAGHNPVIVRKTNQEKTEILRPAGLALGFERGEKFSMTIQEVKTSIQSGDQFVFYTDGFTEAMNKSLEEFGEERFRTAIEKLSSGSAGEVLEGIFKEMKTFTGKAKQHDDMTMVVVRIA